MKKISLLSCGLLALFLSAHTFDLPMLYRAPMFQTDPSPKIKKWTTSLAVQVGSGDTRKSFNVHEDKTSLFNAHGAFDIVRLGTGIEDITSKPVTNAYWGAGGHFADLTGLGANDGKVEVGGHFRTTEWDFILQQNLFWGFYVHAFLPYKDVKIDQIGTRNLGAANVKGVNITNFMNNDLPAILKENGFTSKSFYDRFKKSDCGDLVLSVGWQDYKDYMKGLVTAMGGVAQASVIVPTASDQDINQIFSIPLGYYGSVGFIGRGSAELTLWNILTIGAQIGGIVFLEDDRDFRLKTDKDQNGWLILQKAHGRLDLGSVWDIGGYAKFDKIVRGFSVAIGYSFTKQEETRIHVKDDNYLKTVIQNANPPEKPWDAYYTQNVVLVSQDDYANSDSRLVGWETQTLHFVAEYDASIHLKKWWGPFIRVQYSYPIYGKYSWASDFVAGKLGISATWNF